MLPYHTSLTHFLVSRICQLAPSADLNAYYLSGSDAIKAVRIAMKHWMQNTCIKFVPHTYEWNYIRFVAEFG